MRRNTIPPAELAKVDQLGAELAEIVDLAVTHLASCEAVPAGVCIGENAVLRIGRLGHPKVETLLEEAVAQLARAAGPRNGPVG